MALTKDGIIEASKNLLKCLEENRKDLSEIDTIISTYSNMDYNEQIMIKKNPELENSLEILYTTNNRKLTLDKNQLLSIKKTTNKKSVIFLIKTNIKKLDGYSFVKISNDHYLKKIIPNNNDEYYSIIITELNHLSNFIDKFGD